MGGIGDHYCLIIEMVHHKPDEVTAPIAVTKIFWHRRQEPFYVDHKTYAKLSTFVKYVIKFVGRANLITNFEFAEEYAKNNK